MFAETCLRTVANKRLLAQVRVANPREEIEQEDVKDTMAASTWFSAGKGKFHAKNSFRKTIERDTSERSPGYKLLLGNIPVMKHEVAWYPQAYSEPELRRWPREYADEAPERIREYFLECTIGHPELPALKVGSAVATWTDEYVRRRTSMVGITQTDRRNALEALRQDMHPYQRTA
ncbi:hypothetical protein LPJ74_003188 [Coemansia sp. RSA 1843]|nr:hypothetical protein LPJ74_003188 [Coemansia sp. RSA 1843]